MWTWLRTLFHFKGQGHEDFFCIFYSRIRIRVRTLEVRRYGQICYEKMEWTV